MQKPTAIEKNPVKSLWSFELLHVLNHPRPILIVELMKPRGHLVVNDRIEQATN